MQSVGDNRRFLYEKTARFLFALIIFSPCADKLPLTYVAAALSLKKKRRLHLIATGEIARVRIAALRALKII